MIKRNGRNNGPPNSKFNACGASFEPLMLQGRFGPVGPLVNIQLLHNSPKINITYLQSGYPFSAI